MFIRELELKISNLIIMGDDAEAGEQPCPCPKSDDVCNGESDAPVKEARESRVVFATNPKIEIGIAIDPVKHLRNKFLQTIDEADLDIESRESLCRCVAILQECLTKGSEHVDTAV